MALALLYLCGTVVYRWSWDRALAATRIDAQRRLDLFTAVLSRSVQRYEYLPYFLAGHPVIADTLRHQNDPGRVAKLNSVLQSLNGQARCAAIYVMNPEGLTIASSNRNQPLSFVGRNFSFRPYFGDAMRQGSGHFHGIGIVDPVPGYYLSYRIDDAGTPIGVVAVKAYHEDLDERWDSEASHIVVSDKNGIIFLSSNKEWNYRSFGPLSTEAAKRLSETSRFASSLKPPLPIRHETLLEDGARLVRMEDFRVRTSHPGEREYLVQSKALPSSDWTVTVFSDLKEARTVARVELIAVLAGVTVLVFAALYAQQLRRRSRERERARLALEEKRRELEVLNVHLQAAAVTDPLTGIYNRRHFLAMAEQTVSSARRYRRNLSVLMIDIDHFKQVNDTYGHAAGDEALLGVTRLCRDALRAADILARFGGEELVIALPETIVADALRVADRLRKKIEATGLPTTAGDVRLTVSVGVAEYRFEEEGIEPALKRADDALYEAKQSGRNRTVQV